jgi:ribosomal protein L12E/L44/L45/RPP1/RPP2
MISKVVAAKNCSTESDDIAHVNSFIDSLNDDDIKELIGDGLNRAPAKPFKPIR